MIHDTSQMNHNLIGKFCFHCKNIDLKKRNHDIFRDSNAIKNPINSIPLEVCVRSIIKFHCSIGFFFSIKSHEIKGVKKCYSLSFVIATEFWICIQL